MILSAIGDGRYKRNYFPFRAIRHSEQNNQEEIIPFKMNEMRR